MRRFISEIVDLMRILGEIIKFLHVFGFPKLGLGLVESSFGIGSIPIFGCRGLEHVGQVDALRSEWEKVSDVEVAMIANRSRTIDSLIHPVAKSNERRVSL